MKLIRAFFLIINILLILFMLIALWGGSVSPERFILPAYFTLAFPVILFLNVFFIIFWLLFRRWYFLLSLMLLIVSYPKYKAAIPLHVNKTKKELPEGSFSIMTYNTWKLGGFQKHTKESPNPVIQYVLDSDADIVCMQEFQVATKDFITHEEMIKIFKKYPYKHIYYKNTRSTRKSGIATFSKYRIINQETIEFNSRQNSAMFSDIIIGKDTIRLINCHLESNRLTEQDKAMPIELRKNFDAENISSVASNLSKKLGIAYKARAQQADYIAETIKNSPYPILLCGDFNDVPLSYTYTKIKGDLTDIFVESGFGLGNTFHEKLYKFRIDYLFCDQNFIPLQFIIDKVKYSDHYPLLCNLKIEEK